MKKDEKMLLIDGNSLAHRAFYALPPLKTSNGVFTNAVFGFVKMLLRLLKEEKPDYIAVAFDKKGPTFRHEEFSEYKSQRIKTPPELTSQFPILKEVLDAFNVQIIEKEGFEADDIIGTLAKTAEKEGIYTYIVTGDKDALQLVSDKIMVYLTRRGITDVEKYDEAKIEQEYSISPSQVCDLKGLMGDSSDNIPGVPNIGAKTASKLLKKFKSLEDIYDNIEKVEGKKIKENLVKFKDQAFMSKRLTTIITDIPLDLDISQCKLREMNKDKIIKLFGELEFHSLIREMDLQCKKDKETLECSIINTQEQLNDTISKIRDNEQISFKIEGETNNPMTTEIVGISIGIQGVGLFYIPLKSRGSLETEKVLTHLKDVLEDEQIEKISHDIKYDIICLKRYGISLRGYAFDTMLASYVLNPSKSNHDLQSISVTNLHRKVPIREDLLGKGRKAKMFSEIKAEKQAEFSCKRVEAVVELKELLEKQLKDNNLYKLYEEIELPLIEILANMEFTGINVDLQELKRLSEEFGQKIELLENRIYEDAGMKFNINSPKQLGEVLFEKLQLPVIKKTKTGYSTSAEVLEQLKPQHEIIEKIIEYRTLMKLKTTYVDGLINVMNPQTGKIHSSFNQTITSTGRISSTEPNLQNIPVRFEMGRKIRKVFIPSDKNHRFLSADYSQIELRILAHISGDENLIEAFKTGQDIHAKTASEVFNVPIDEVTPEMRNRAKAVNFGIVYGISEYGLSRDLGISRKEAGTYIDNYFERYPGVRDYVRETIKFAKEKGYVVTILNRKRYLPDLHSRNYNVRSFAERTAINTPIQGSAADIIKKAMIEVYNEIQRKKLSVKLVLQVHDELIFDCPEEELEQVKEMVKTKMENTMELKVPLIVDLKVGSNLYNMEKIE